MTQQINFNTDLGIVSIELIDTEFTKFWANHFQKMIIKYNLRLRPVSWPYYESVNKNAFNVIDKILEIIDDINSLDDVSPLPETIVREQLIPLDLTTQQVLNRLHRYCVVGTEFRNRWLYHGKPTFEWVDWGNERYMYLLNLLNQNIHQLEKYVKTPHKVKFKNISSSVEILFSASKYTDVDVYDDGVDVEISESMQKYLQLTGYDVWIKKDTLGKDYITAFSDHDNPDQFDIRPPPMISGGISIDINAGRDELFRSYEFRNWLTVTPIDKHGSYPLGRIVAGKEFLLDATTILDVKLI